MSKQQFRSTNFGADKLAIIARADEVISEYGGQKLSARQVYYRFIGDNRLPATWIDAEYNRKHNLPPDTKNTPKNYQRLIGTLVDARYAGLISWDAIEDRAQRRQDADGHHHHARRRRAFLRTSRHRSEP
jgi:hypothetical protein